MATAETPPSELVPETTPPIELQIYGAGAVLDEPVHPSSMQEPTGTYTDPYDFLNALHRNKVGLFTQNYDLGGVALGLQSDLPSSPTWNNLLGSHVKYVSPVIDQAEHILSSQGGIPAVYFPQGVYAEELREYLVDRGYDPNPGWTDAWMFANPARVTAAIDQYCADLPNTVGIRTGTATKRDWFTFLGVLHESRATPEGTNNPYGSLQGEEYKAIGASVWRILEDGSRGRCIMVERRSPPGKRLWASVAAVAMISYAESSFGRVAHIENVAREPKKSYKDFGKIALLAAAKVGLEFLESDA